MVADEPRAAQIGQDVLKKGGNAADAAAAVAVALGVTLPSRASLGGGGACLARGPQAGEPEGLFFYNSRPKVPPPETYAIAFPAVAGAPGRPSLPGMMRGIAALHAKLGSWRWEQIVAPAENLARFGIPVSRALARDIASSGIPITNAAGQPLREGEGLFQPELAGTLAMLRSRGPGDLYAGQLAAAYAEGIGIEPASLRGSVASLEKATGVKLGRDTIYVTPTPGGAAAQAILQQAGRDRRASRENAAERGAALTDAVAKAAPDVARQSGTDSGSTGIVVVDRDGAAVACSFGMGKLFGARQPAGTTGILAGAPSSDTPESGLSTAALMAVNESTGQFIAALAGGGDASAPAGLVEVAVGALVAEVPLDQVDTYGVVKRGRIDSAPAPRVQPAAIETSETPARVNTVVCRKGLPRDPNSCAVKADPRGAGIAFVVDNSQP